MKKHCCNLFYRISSKIKRIFDALCEKTQLKQHPNAASNATSMREFTTWVKTYTDIKTEVIFEIGANYAQDAEGLRYYFGLLPDDIWVFEAHPDIYAEIGKMYKFNAFNYAVFNESGEMKFNVVDLKTTKNTGVSSIYKHKYSAEAMKEVEVKSIRMDEFMSKHDIPSIDFLKLDVEGCNYEVLEGFGNRLGDIKVLHIEAEHEPIWSHQKLFDDIERILKEYKFEMVIFKRYYTQSDSLWVQKQYIKNEFHK